MLYWTALTLGFLGSTHCVGMCGPLMLALPMTRTQRLMLFLQAVQYNFGRVLTYGLLGFFMGWLGKGLFLADIQKEVSIVLGVLILIGLIFKINWEHQFVRIPIINRYTKFIQSKLALLINRKGSHLALGMLNGLLPCGLVYLALAGAVTTSHPLEGSLFMMLFGLGTMPLMLSLFLVGNVFKTKLKRSLNIVGSFVLFAVAALLIFRGLAIEFPQELRFWEAVNNPVMCH